MQMSFITFSFPFRHLPALPYQNPSSVKDMCCREPLLYGATGSCDGLNKFAELMSTWKEVTVGVSGHVCLDLILCFTCFGELLLQRKKSKYE